MKKAFRLKGLGCANCAAKIEDGVSKLHGVTGASVNFVTTKLIIEAERGDMDAIVAAARDIVRKIEPDVDMQPA